MEGRGEDGLWNVVAESVRGRERLRVFEAVYRGALSELSKTGFLEFAAELQDEADRSSERAATASHPGNGVP